MPTLTGPNILVLAAADTTAPVITLTGSTPVNLTVGDTYTELGATWTDNVDGSGAATVGGDTVNTAVAGTYTVTYNYTDAAGNAATQVTRTVVVAEAVAGITLTGPKILLLIPRDAVVSTSGFTLRSPTFTIVMDGVTDLTAATTLTVSYGGIALSNVTATNATTITTDGINSGLELDAAHDLIITVDGNASTAYSQTLLPPTGYSATTLTSIHAESVYADADYTANAGGDANNISIGDQIVYKNTTNEDATAVVLAADGTYSFPNAVADNVTASQTINWFYLDAQDSYAAGADAVLSVLAPPSGPDETAPVITILGDNPATHAHGTAYTDAGATALDNVDGNITGDITSTSTVDSDTIGTYYVSYDVIDAAGNAATTAIRTVNVTDQTAPVITLNGDVVVSVEQGRAYTELGATWTDAVDGSGETVIGGDTVDTSTIGAYAVTYNKTDSAGNVATQVTRTVNVTADVTAPTIGRIGSPVVYVLQNEPYSEIGATWNDLVDGTGSATVGGDTVNTSVLGSYTVTYDHTDVAGNVADTVTRVVNVVEELPALGGIIVLRDILQPVTRNIIKSIFED